MHNLGAAHFRASRILPVIINVVVSLYRNTNVVRLVHRQVYQSGQPLNKRVNVRMFVREKIISWRDHFGISRLYRLQFLLLVAFNSLINSLPIQKKF